MTQEITEFEIAVIEAAQDWADAIEGSQYGPMKLQIANAEKALMTAMANLAAESDGRWRAPMWSDPSGYSRSMKKD